MMRWLLVEDDKMLGEPMQIGLEQDGYAADWVRERRVLADLVGVEADRPLVAVHR